MHVLWVSAVLLICAASATSMSTGNEKIVWLVRHGQAEHNVETTPETWKILDPSLTPLGEGQAKNIWRALKKLAHAQAHPLVLEMPRPVEGTPLEDYDDFFFDGEESQSDTNGEESNNNINNPSPHVLSFAMPAKVDYSNQAPVAFAMPSGSEAVGQQGPLASELPAPLRGVAAQRMRQLLHFDLVVTSPLLRTMQTMSLAFPYARSTPVPKSGGAVANNRRGHHRESSNAAEVPVDGNQLAASLQHLTVDEQAPEAMEVVGQPSGGAGEGSILLGGGQGRFGAASAEGSVAKSRDNKGRCVHCDNEAKDGYPHELLAIAHGDIQETGNVPCDTGSPVETLHGRFPHVDLSLLPGNWYEKKGLNNGEPPNTLQRARRFVQWLQQRPEKNIVVVGHAGIFRYLLGDGEARFLNGEVRCYSLENLEFVPYGTPR